MTATPTSDEAALLAAIAAKPDEDSVRLAYADWLDDHEGHDRAEFIRVQVELEGRKFLGDGHTHNLLNRESALLDAHPEWMPVCVECGGCGEEEGTHRNLCTHCSGTGRVGTMRRGFVFEVPVPTLASVLERPDVVCPACRGLSDWAIHDYDVPDTTRGCGTCGNHGVIEGDWRPTDYAVRLLDRYRTVRGVVPADRVQVGPGQVAWLRDDEMRFPYSLPAAVFEAAYRLHKHKQRDGRWLYFDTPEAAVAALAIALADVLRPKPDGGAA